MRKTAILGIGFIIVWLSVIVYSSNPAPTPVPTSVIEQGNPVTPLSTQTPRVATLTAVGDISFSGISPMIVNDPMYPWYGTKEVLCNSETLLVGNLEAPLTNHTKIYTEKTWILRGDPRTVKSLTTAGFDLLTLANNHILDYGPTGLAETLSVLREAKIPHTGAGMNLNDAREPAFVATPEGVTFAFLSYSLVYPDLFWARPTRPGTPYGGPENFVPDIKKAKGKADFVVVSFHWSNELMNYPRAYQKSYGRQCIDAGATLVLGHHPHVLQGFEVYKGGFIAYSLGNFVFGTRSTKIRDSAILQIHYDREGLIKAVIYPVNVYNAEVKYQPRLRTGADCERVLQDLRTFSREFGTKIESEGNTGVITIRKS